MAILGISKLLSNLTRTTLSSEFNKYDRYRLLDIFSLNSQTNFRHDSWLMNKRNLRFVSSSIKHQKFEKLENSTVLNYKFEGLLTLVVSFNLRIGLVVEYKS